MTEKILCAAIWFDDDRQYDHQPFNIKSGYVICGHRHHNCFTTAYILDNNRSYTRYEKQQGFITNTNMFVDRYLAAQIAYKAKQIKLKIDKLFSEDLY